MLLDRLGKYEQLNLGLKKELDKERKSHQVSHTISMIRVGVSSEHRRREGDSHHHKNEHQQYE